MRTEPGVSVTERRKTKLIMCSTGVMWYLACFSNLFAPHTHTHTHTHTVAYRGGDLGCSNHPPPEIPKALQNRAKLNPIVKTVKN